MRLFHVKESFQKVARYAASNAVDVILASRGEDIYRIAEPRALYVTPQLLSVIALQMQTALQNATQYREAFYKEEIDPETVPEEMPELARECLQLCENVSVQFSPA